MGKKITDPSISRSARCWRWKPLSYTDAFDILVYITPTTFLHPHSGTRWSCANSLSQNRPWEPGLPILSKTLISRQSFLFGLSLRIMESLGIFSFFPGGVIWGPIKIHFRKQSIPASRHDETKWFTTLRMRILSPELLFFSQLFVLNERENYVAFGLQFPDRAEMVAAANNEIRVNPWKIAPNVLMTGIKFHTWLTLRQIKSGRREIDAKTCNFRNQYCWKVVLWA